MLFFKTKPLLSEQDQQFQIATFKWLLKYFGGQDFVDTKLILPIREHFPQKLDDNDDAAEKTFEQVKAHAGLEKWPCKLVAQDEDIDPVVAPALAVSGAPGGPMGTFGVEENNETIITYNPAIIGQPVQLIATFAHELAHYLTGTSREEPPGGWENWEFATDISATFMGFGVFMANSASNFQQYTNVDSQGWKYSRSGYLSEAEHIYALALFMGLRSIPLEDALSHLKPGLKKLLKKAVKEIGKTNIIKELCEIEFEPVVPT
ncbi:MAG: hypothetical protein HRT35_08025 [Algicola sp.]|nr:hypothetical protein [Algicola sp.]